MACVNARAGGVMLYYRREIDVNAIIEAVLNVRALERTNAPGGGW
jgi:hypothetical protein